MIRYPGCRASRRACQRLVRHVRQARDGGFILLESIVAITVITIVMSAVGVEFAGGMITSGQQRAQQGAVQLADSAVEQIRALNSSDLMTGRDFASVTTQFSNPPVPIPAAVQTWLAQMDPASDPNALPGSGPTAAIPTVGVPRHPSSVNYTVNDYLGWCNVATTGPTSCVRKITLVGITSIQYVRAVVAVTWSGSRCGASVCSYVTSTLASADPNPTFKVNQPLPAAPTIAATVPPTCSNAVCTVAVGDAVSLPLLVTNNTGVPLFTWTILSGSLPSGLRMSSTGLITGTVSATSGTPKMSVQVTDAFLRTSTKLFTWTVEALIVANNPLTQTSTIGTALLSPGLQMSASGGSLIYAWTDPSKTLPLGLQISSSGLMTGTPTALGTSAVTLTVNSAGVAPVTVTFSWIVNPAPHVVSPGDQVTVRGAPVTLDMSVYASGGTGAYTYTASNLPSGLAINSVTGRITGTPSTTANSTTTGITISLTDSTGASSTTTSFSWNVTTDLVISVGDQTTYQLTAVSVNLALLTIGGAGHDTFTATGLPSWVVLNGSTGLMTGTAPTITGSARTSAITVTVTDGSAHVASSSFNWYVTDLVWTGYGANGSTFSTPHGTSATGNAATYVSGGSSATRAYVATGVPTGVSVATNGTITGTASTIGTWTVRLSATDSVGATVTSTITWHVT